MTNEAPTPWRKSYNSRLGNWSVLHGGWCKRGETSVVVQIPMSLDPKADEKIADRIVEAVNGYATMKKALDVAVAMLSQNEPGDSRAASPIFVALAAVSCGLSSPDVNAVIDEELDRLKFEQHSCPCGIGSEPCPRADGSLGCSPAPVPLAWRYEASTAMEWRDGKPIAHTNWQWRISETKPCMGDGMRNLTPLYAKPESDQ